MMGDRLLLPEKCRSLVGYDEEYLCFTRVNGDEFVVGCVKSTRRGGIEDGIYWESRYSADDLRELVCGF